MIRAMVASSREVMLASSQEVMLASSQEVMEASSREVMEAPPWEVLVATRGEVMMDSSREVMVAISREALVAPSVKVMLMIAPSVEVMVLLLALSARLSLGKMFALNLFYSVEYTAAACAYTIGLCDWAAWPPRRPANSTAYCTFCVSKLPIALDPFG